MDAVSHILCGPTWGIRCDRPDCLQYLDGIGRDPSAQRRSATAQAEARGWQLSNHADVPLDFCEAHIDHTRSVRMEITRLYSEDGTPVKRKFGGSQ